MTGFKMGFWQVCGVAPPPAGALVRLHEGQGARELLGQKADGDDMETFGLVGLKIVCDTKDGWIDDIQPSLLLDLPNGSGLEGLAGFKIASRDRPIWGMGALPFADEDLAGGVQKDDSDADAGTGVGGRNGFHWREIGLRGRSRNAIRGPRSIHNT